MNLKSGFPFWLVKDGLPYNYPKLDKDVETDVVILGGGISGALVRYYLVNAGFATVTLDARTIGLGSTCASTALLQYEIDTPLHELRKMVGQKSADRSFHLCNDAITQLGNIARELKCGSFEFKDSLYFAAYKKDVPFLRREFDARKEAGFNVEFLEPEHVKRDYGFESPAAILSHHGAQLDAYMFTHALLQHRKAKPAKIYDRSEVVKIKHHKNGVDLETANGSKIKCKKLVYATGYEVVNFIDEPIVDLLSTYAIVSEQYNAPKFWKNEALLWNTADPYLYVRTTSDWRILVGGRDEAFTSKAKREKLLPKKAQQLANDIRKMFPDLDFKQEFSWVGTFGSTKDGLPYIGEYPKLANSYFALGFGGNGITFSLVAAQIILRFVVGETKCRRGNFPVWAVTQFLRIPQNPVSIDKNAETRLNLSELNLKKTKTMSKPSKFPEQKQPRPGKESNMVPEPEIVYPEYKGSEKLKGKVALITGGDSGIGRSIAVYFAKEGANVAIVYLSEDKDANETKRMVEAENVCCLLIKGDLKKERFCKSAVEKTIKEFGKLNVLVNNAAQQFPKTDIRDIGKKQLSETFETNIYPMFYIVKEALEHLEKGDCIINTTSVTAYRGSEHLLDYSSTKGAIVTFTRSLSTMLAEKGIRVNAVAPGPIWTPLIVSTFDKVSDFGSDTPMKRAGQPSEVGPAYVFLASKDASYITGQVIHVNGGEMTGS